MTNDKIIENLLKQIDELHSIVDKQADLISVLTKAGNENIQRQEIERAKWNQDLLNLIKDTGALEVVMASLQKRETSAPHPH